MKYSGAEYCSVPRMGSPSGATPSLIPATRDRAEVDQFGGARAVDHHVIRAQVLVDHILSVEGAQALADLFNK